MQQFRNGLPATLLRGVVWRKSQHSNPSGACVELADVPGTGIAMRNSRYPDGPALIYTRADIAEFLQAARRGDFDNLIDQN